MVFHGSKGSQKLCVSISTYLPIQEVLKYPIKYASVLNVQKLSVQSILQIVLNATSWVFNS